MSVFSITQTELSTLFETRDINVLRELGGVEGVAEKLQSHTVEGLCDSSEGLKQDRISAFGKNVYPTKPMKSFFKMFFAAMGDTMLIILMVLAVISIVLGLAFPDTPADRKFGWIEGAAIIAAVFIISTVTAVNDYQKELKFRELSKQNDLISVKVLRDGQNTSILIDEIMVGDVVELDTGDQIPADGILIQGFDLKINESAMTGEADAIRKTADSPFLLSGCQVTEGCGKMIVTCVGPNSEWGKALALLNADDEDSQTPLEERLDHLAAVISKAGVAFAVATFLALLAGWLIKKIVMVSRGEEKFAWSDVSTVVRFAVIAVSIVAVAVPEGLPLAVTISLAYSVKKMMKDNNLVRHLVACETMGGATNICSDKTGTLTLNEMRVTKSFIGDTEFYDGSLPSSSTIHHSVLTLFSDGTSVNSKANLVAPKSSDSLKEYEVQGNKTEGALLIMLKDMGIDYKSIRDSYELSNRVHNIYTFSSKMKRMSVIIETEHGDYQLHVKGASEIVVGLCTRFLNADGSISPMTDDKKKQLNSVIETLANTGLRTLGIAYKPLRVTDNREDWEERELMESDLTLIGIVGIKDPLRPEVLDAVTQCKRSGIFVRMVTGDNILTAQHIARECGILDGDGIAMEGPDFRKLTDAELDEILPKLQVLARSSPTDKFKLVKRLKELGEVVAVTGDGTNDGPALKEADVGLSMGISGTQIAKEASDIIIMDDNFSSIVKSVLWGRSIFENIRKFLTFQLTVNVVALLISIITALTTFAMPTENGKPAEPPLTAVQLLWVNLIMDTFAALALATEPPVPELLNSKPYGRTESLINKKMWVSIIGQSIYQLIVLLILYYLGGKMCVGGKCLSTSFDMNRTVVFNTFVLCQIFNEFNCRKINFEWNIFANLHKSFMFLFILVLTFAGQILIVSVGGRFTQTTPLNIVRWLICVALAVLSIPVGFLIRALARLFLKYRRGSSTQYSHL